MFGRRLRELKEDDICRECIYVATDEHVRHFRCRRFPPVKYKDETGRLHTDFPPVSPDDWCGEFQRKANSSIRRYWSHDNRY